MMSWIRSLPGVSHYSSFPKSLCPVSLRWASSSPESAWLYSLKVLLYTHFTYTIWRAMTNIYTCVTTTTTIYRTFVSLQKVPLCPFEDNLPITSRLRQTLICCQSSFAFSKISGIPSPRKTTAAGHPTTTEAACFQCSTWPRLWTSVRAMPSARPLWSPTRPLGQVSQWERTSWGRWLDSPEEIDR